VTDKRNARTDGRQRRFKPQARCRDRGLNNLTWC